MASQSLDSVSIEAPGPNERIGNARFRGADREINVGSVGVVGLGGGRAAPLPPVMLSVAAAKLLVLGWGEAGGGAHGK